METYKNIRDKSPLLFETTIIKDNLNMIKVEIDFDDDTSKKIYLPEIDLSDKEIALYAIAEFDDKAEKMDLDVETRYNYFREILSIAARQTWDTLVANIPANPTENDFKATRVTLLASLFDEESFESFTQYLFIYRKPPHVTAKVLYNRLNVLFTYSQCLLNATLFDDGCSTQDVFPSHVSERSKGCVSPCTWFVECCYLPCPCQFLCNI